MDLKVEKTNKTHTVKNSIHPKAISNSNMMIKMLSMLIRTLSMKSKITMVNRITDKKHMIRTLMDRNRLTMTMDKKLKLTETKFSKITKIMDKKTILKE